MDKLITKTVIITTSVVLATFLLLFSLVSFISPKSMGNVTARMGLKKMSLSYSEAEYYRTDSISSLGTLVKRSIEYDDESRIIKFSEKFTNRYAFKEYCKKEDAKSGGKNICSFENYVYGNYSVALYEKNRVEDAFLIAKTPLTKSYPASNSLTFLFLECIKEKDANTLKNCVDFLNTLKDEINLYEDITEADKLSYIENIEKDINFLTNNINV